jgi:hypothetical protein
MDLRKALGEHGFAVEVQAGFPEPHGFRSAFLGLVRRAAISLRLVPKTMSGKAFLKRVFCGPLEPIPGRVDPREFTPAPLTKVQRDTNLARYKVLYVSAEKE